MTAIPSWYLMIVLEMSSGPRDPALLADRDLEVVHIDQVPAAGRAVRSARGLDHFGDGQVVKPKPFLIDVDLILG